MKRPLEVEEIPERVVRGRFEEDEEGNINFIDVNQERIPGEVMFSTYRNLVIEIFYKTEDKFRLLVNLEKSGKVGRNFVIKHQLWKVVFQLDFPDIFEMVAEENPPRNMKTFYKQALDHISRLSEREHTYWKRYYEMVVNVSKNYNLQNEIFPRFKTILFSNFMKNYNRGWLPDIGEVNIPREWLDHTIPENRNSDGVATGRFLSGYSVWMSLRHSGIYYIFWMIAGGFFAAPIENNFPITGIKINLNDETFERVPFDEILPDLGDIIYYKHGSPEDGQVWVSKDLLFLDRFVTHPTARFIRYSLHPQYNGENSLLVSCKICGKVDKALLKKCVHCGNVYCGKACQAIDH